AKRYKRIELLYLLGKQLLLPDIPVVGKGAIDSISVPHRACAIPPE
ncbi:MAG: hypothetical protein IT388_06175, partial [Nitrospirales bacterium]|nr:hypothetical protein [Nitrospirales bacterium]